MESKGKLAIWRDKLDPNVVNLGAQGKSICCWGQVHIDAFFDWFDTQGDKDYLKILEMVKDGPVHLSITLKTED